MTSLTPTDSVTVAAVAVMQFSHCHQPSDILRILNQQRCESTFCDVILRADERNTSLIRAHRCILAASSDYFSALFRHGSSDDVRVTEVVIPLTSCDVLVNVVDFLYTGVISISEETLEETIRVGDFLGIRKILDFCSDFMRKKLDHSNCLKFKVLSDFYPLHEVTDFVRNYILPRMATLVRCRKTAEVPVETLRQLLTDEEVNYPREIDLLHLVQNCLHCQKDPDPAERAESLSLLSCIDFEFLSPETIRRDVLSNPDTLEWLSAQPQQFLDALGNMDADGGGNRSSPRRNFVEAIICRSRASRRREEPQLLLYLVCEDSWRTLKEPTDEKEMDRWTGLETIVIHNMCLYTLSSCTEDMNGYMHPSKETKVFSKLNIRTGEWKRLPSPSIVSRQTMLISLQDTLVAVDLTGKVERYHSEETKWKEWCKEGLPGLPICFLPISKSNDLYLFRTSSSGYSFDFSQRSFSLYYLRDTSHSWVELSQIEDTDLFDDSDQVNLFDCVISPGLMAFKDELGNKRAEFNTESRDWSAFPPKVSRPGFVREIFGSAECGQRAYFVGRSALGLENVFAMHDHSKRRFKMVKEPPTDISGLICHVTMPASSIELLTVRDGPGLGNVTTGLGYF